jgi:hypothetical protein
MENNSHVDEMLDAESIFIYKAIKKCNRNLQVMVELGSILGDLSISRE